MPQPAPLKTYGNPPKTLVDLCRKHPEKVAELGSEVQPDDDGYWIYLRPGWCSAPQEHIVHEWSVKDVLAAFASVRPCACKDCSAPPKT